MDVDSENRWAVYPIEKVEAAMKELSEAIAAARAKVREQQAHDDSELDKLICPGCRDGLWKDGSFHVYADGCSTEDCFATEHRKQALRQYFANERIDAKNYPVPRRLNNAGGVQQS